MNIGPHWFWWSLTVACLVWYSTITIYVAIRGVIDIRQMLARLEQQQESDRLTETQINPPDRGEDAS